ncbi:MarR family transcriptional regulator [Candidatus Pacearchaeota archaeon]|nr:MarR family transcriptional regulator [Candidatus Pacearchaeota archaeon]
MIDFACKRFDLDEIVKCGLGLTKAELSIMKFFVKNLGSEFSSGDVAKELGLNLTTVQRAAKKLHGQKIIIRHQKNMSKGGYIYTYESVPKNEIRNILKKIIRKWSSKVEDQIDLW